MKEQEIKPKKKKKPNERRTKNLSDKEFKAVIRILTELGNIIYEHSENFNK